MGAGKTSVGRALAQQLNWEFEDLDDRIERREGRVIAQIFKESGEQEFRRAEHEALAEALRELGGSATRIVAVGGGAFVQPANARLLRAAKVPTVFLDAAVEDLWARCRKQAREAGRERPLHRSEEQFRQLYETRREGYAKAKMRVQTGDRAVADIATEIAEKLGLRKIALRMEEGEVE